MKKIFPYCLFALAVLLLSPLAGCRQEGVIPARDLTQILADFYEVDAAIDLMQENSRDWENVDSLRVYRPILEAHGFTDEDFRHSLDYYLHNPKTLIKICAQADEELQRRAALQPDEDVLVVTEDQELPELTEGAEPALEIREAAGDTASKPIRRPAGRRQHKKMTRQELKQLEKELQ